MKILIISYYAFPLNAVPSYRIQSFCEGFTQQGAEVTLLTRHWNKTFTSWEDVLKSDKRPPEIKNEKGYRQIFLPYKAKPKESRFRLISMLSVFYSYLKGDLQPEINSFNNFKDYALELMVNEGDFDLVFVSAPPNNLVRLANFLYKKTKVPFIVDFRDYLNDQYLTVKNNLNLRSKLLNIITNFYVSKWLKKSSLVSTVSPLLKDVFETKMNIKTDLVLNGYEESVFESNKDKVMQNKTFTLRYVGTAYKGIDFSVIIKGIEMFKIQYPDRKLFLEFVGTNNSQFTSIIREKFEDNEYHFIKNRIPKNEVVEKCVNSDILLLPWNVFKNNYGTKVFDYLASGSHILLCPPDKSVVEELINSCENGSVANSEKEVLQILEKQYALWLKGENKSKINNYPQFARENIAVEFYQKLKALVE